MTDPCGPSVFALRATTIAPRRIGILQGARLASKRIPNKLLEIIGDERLIDRGLRLLTDVAAVSNSEAFVTLWRGDDPLWRAAKDYDVKIVELTEVANNAETWDEAFAGLAEKLADRFDWIVDVNFLCRPFLRVETACKMVDFAKIAAGPYVATCQHRGLLWDANGQQLLGHGETANTKTNPVYHDLAHLAYGIPTYMLANEQAASFAKPFSVDLRWYERVDIDTPDDLAFARVVHSYITEGGLLR